MSFRANSPSDSPYAPSRPPSSSTSIGASVLLDTGCWGQIKGSKSTSPALVRGDRHVPSRAGRRLRPQSRGNSRPQTAPVQPTLVSPTTVAAAAAAGGSKLTSREAAQQVEHREMTTTHAQVRNTPRDLSTRASLAWPQSSRMLES